MTVNAAQSRTLIPALLLAGLLVLRSTASHAQEAIGSATTVVPQAEGTQEGQTRTLSAGSAVHAKDLVHTGDSGIANLQFHDSSKLSVGPKTEVLLDKFVYDPKKSTGTVAVEAARGSFRFVTGPQSKRKPDPPPLQYWLPHVLRRCSSSGSLAMLEAMRRASSWGQPPHRHAPACEIAYMRQSYHSSAALMGGQEVKP